jgi:hypothetical protein
MWQGGGEFQTPEGKSGFDSPATVQALKFWQDAVNSGAAPRQVLGGGADIVANLGSGYCAMQNVGIWGISAMDNNAPDVPYGIFKLPTPANGKYVTVGGGWAFVANARGRMPETAAEFCAWALASMDPASIERVVNWCTVAKSDMPPRDSALKRAVPPSARARWVSSPGRFTPAPAPSRACRRRFTRSSPMPSSRPSSAAPIRKRRRLPPRSNSMRSSLPTAAHRCSDPNLPGVAAVTTRRSPCPVETGTELAQ